MLCAVEAVRFGGVGCMDESISAAPETEVWALLPCFDIMRNEDAISDAVVEML